MSELERVKAFALRKNEITVAAANEVDKLQKHLLFVSLQDYNKVLEENRKLKLLVMDWEDDPKVKQFISREVAIEVSGMTEEAFDEFLKKHKVRYRHNASYTYYNRQDLLRNLTCFQKSVRIKA